MSKGHPWIDKSNMKLYIVRHGETEENIKNIIMGHHHGVLSKLGKEQVVKLANQLKNYQFNHIYSSDLQRCVDTTMEIRKFHPNTPITFTKQLRETNFGVFQGVKDANIDWNQLGPDIMTRKLEDGESFGEVVNRINLFLEGLKKDHKNDSVLIVTHSGAINAFISIIEKMSAQQVFDRFNAKNADMFEVEMFANGDIKFLNL